MIGGYIKRCVICQRFRSNITKASISLITQGKRYERFVIDCVDLRKYSQENRGLGWMVNCIDGYLRYLWSFTVPNKAADTIIAFISSIFDTFPLPQSIQTDNGGEFVNLKFAKYLHDLNIIHLRGRSRNPKAQGVVERVNQTIKRWVTKGRVPGTNEWVTNHKAVINRYNHSKHSSTKMSPFFLIFGESGRTPRLLDTDYFNIVEDPLEEEPEERCEKWDFNEIEGPTMRWNMGEVDGLSSPQEIANSDQMGMDLDLIEEIHRNQELCDYEDVMLNPIISKETVDEVASNSRGYKEKVEYYANRGTRRLRLSICNSVLFRREFDRTKVLGNYHLTLIITTRSSVL